MNWTQFFGWAAAIGSLATITGALVFLYLTRKI